MPTYLFTIYLKYSGSRRFSFKQLELRTIISASSEDEAIHRGLGRVGEAMRDYFYDSHKEVDYSDAILDYFDMSPKGASGLEEHEGYIDESKVEIYDGAILRYDRSVYRPSDGGRRIARRLREKWSM